MVNHVRSLNNALLLLSLSFGIHDPQRMQFEAHLGQSFIVLIELELDLKSWL